MTDRFIRSGPAVFIFFLALNFVAHFLYMRDFGFYNDDYIYITPFLSDTFADLATATLSFFISVLNGSLGESGRALGVFSMRAFPVIGTIGGVVGWLRYS
jgi:hypothetical protein